MEEMPLDEKNKLATLMKRSNSRRAGLHFHRPPRLSSNSARTDNCSQPDHHQESPWCGPLREEQKSSPPKSGFPLRQHDWENRNVLNSVQSWICVAYKSREWGRLAIGAGALRERRFEQTSGVMAR